MTDASRRTFLRGAGVVAGAATATALIPGGSALASRPTAGPAEPESPSGDASTETLVAYVKDARSGQISVLSGDREVVVTDRGLAQQLARLAE